MTLLPSVPAGPRPGGRRARLSAVSTSALLAALALAPEASADVTKTQCVEADTQAQQLRREEKLGASRAQLKICTEPACPALVRDDCAQRLDELDKVQPTLVFEVKDAQGRDLTAVKITVDGQPLAEGVSGAAIPVEPGTHSFRFEVRGEKPVTEQLVLREGDKARHERVYIGGAPPVAPASGGSRGGGQRTAGALVGGIGLVGLGLGGLFGALASSKWSAAQKDCPTSQTCTPAAHQAAQGEHDNAVTLATVSTISFIAGGVLTAGGIVLFVSAPSGSSGEGRPAQGLVLSPSGGLDGLGMTFRGWF